MAPNTRSPYTMPHIPPMDEKTTVQERVYRTLRAAIMTGRFKPGHSVTIRGLADEMQVSSMPVREFLRRLISERALTLKPNRRIEVPAMTMERFEELTAARVALETLAARRAFTTSQKAGTLHELAQHLEIIDADQDQAITQGDWEGYLQKNLDFHFTLYAAARSDVTVPLIESLWLQIGPFLYLTRESLGVIYNEDRHKEAVAALRAGDEAALAHAIEQDIRDGMGSLPRDKLPFRSAREDPSA